MNKLKKKPSPTFDKKRSSFENLSFLRKLIQNTNFYSKKTISRCPNLPSKNVLLKSIFSRYYWL